MCIFAPYSKIPTGVHVVHVNGALGSVAVKNTILVGKEASLLIMNHHSESIKSK